MNRVFASILPRVVFLTCLILFCSIGAFAQNATPSSAGSTAAQGVEQGSSGDKSTERTAPVGAAQSTDSSVTAIGSASPLDLANGSLRWGDFYVRDASFTQLYDHDNYAILNAPSSYSTNVSLFQTDLAFNHLTRRGQIALQYQPRLAIVNGQFLPDFSNQNVALNLVLDSTPRWRVEAMDNFQYFSSQNMFASNYVDANTFTGRSLQNNFLDGAGSLLNETVELTATYRWTARTSISLSPTFNYLHTDSTLSGPLTSYVGSMGVSLGYQLTARQQIGVYFHSDYIRLMSQNATSPETTTQVYAAGMNYSRQMGPTWWISAAFAATRNPATGVSTPWTFSGSASLTRGFGRSSAGLVYARNLAVGYVTNNFADRIDGFLSLFLARGLQLRNSLGYQRESDVTNPISAEYAVSEITYRLTPRISGFINYGYRLQNGDSIRVLVGHRNFVSGGIRWDSSPAEYY